MKVLWFAGPCGYQPATSGVSTGYNGGGWMPSLLNEVKKLKGVELGVCFAMEGQPFKVAQDGITYYPFPNHSKPWKDKILDIIYYKHPERDRILWHQYEERFKKVIEDFKPDVIHLFGSELYLGLVSFVARCPVVLHVQGLLSLYIYIWFPSGVSKKSYLFQDWNPKRVYERFQLYVYWQRSCYREQQVLARTQHVIGRTHWDELATKILNPDRVYHYGGEILRQEFYKEPNRSIPKRLSIVTTSSSPMYKGFDYVLQTAYILKNVMHLDFDWKVYGNVDPTFHQKFTGLNHKELNIQIMGVASAATLRDAISNATVYFQPSYIENSPNSVCEAQILGVPVVATNVGGTASLIEEGVTGFLVPTNDPYTAAYRIAQVAEDNSLNSNIGKKAREVALKRHDKEKIVNELLSTYKELLSECRNDGDTLEC
jgi:glycosyltransferase involved in cell wall biosynthesis